MSDLGAIIFLSIIGSFLGLIGGIVVIYNKRLRPVLSKYSISFAAGVLITVSIMAIMPEAVDLAGEEVFPTILYTFIGAYFFEHLILGIHHHERGEKGIHFDTSVPLVIIGDTIHNLIDGIAIAATYLANPGLGIVTAISTFLHEVPHEIGDFGILLKSGFSNTKVILINGVSACATILGALLVYYVPQDDAVIGQFLAIAAGLFLYLGATDFLPHIQDKKTSKNNAIFSLVCGVMIMVATLVLIPHPHPEDEIIQPVGEYENVENSTNDVQEYEVVPTDSNINIFSPRP